MNDAYPIQALAPHRTTWHITFGTYGARLHGGDRPTVDREHNRRGEAFIEKDGERENFEREFMRSAAVVLPLEVRSLIEQTIPLFASVATGPTAPVPPRLMRIMCIRCLMSILTSTARMCENGSNAG